MKIDANEIKRALAARHEGDFFLAEVKSGSTYMGTADRILDGLAIKRSWARPRLTGYEVKTSRGDFLRDAKFTTYLPLVHELYIAAPENLVRREELPADVGLIWYSPAKKTLAVKKRPPLRKIEISAQMLMYVIISRLDGDRAPFHSTKAELWREWLDNKRDNRSLGLHVRNKLTQEIGRLEAQLSRETSRVRADNLKEREEMIRRLAKHGMPYYHDPVRWLEERLTRNYPPILDDVARSLEAALRRIESEKAKGAAAPDESAETQKATAQEGLEN